MKFEFIIRNVVTKEDDIYSRYNVPEDRYESAFKGFNERLIQLNKKDLPRSNWVLLINKLDDNGEFLEVVQ